MSRVEARIALARLIEDRIEELGVDRSEFMRATGFTKTSAFTSYLRGYSNLPLWQVFDVAEVLELDEREVLLMCLAQFHGDLVMELIKRHITL
ncbi:hypothetical protein [Shinella sedimenti]|uniref:HTH cro/C1-type domain-containing protein n=1 Tax=Shinella sedimenti TaxID=2919913 RepID=A0ABT0CS23_9HYPH|nr:hypothetical protein [Shinella sedimenti]MCJ8151414.1 hypothetical protein [Shinella sedimenti]